MGVNDHTQLSTGRAGQVGVARAKGVRLAFAILRLGLMVSAACAIVRLASAEIDFNRDTIPAVRDAAKIGSSEYWAHLAELEPNQATHLLKEATLADPRNSSAWISLGLAEERLAQDRDERSHNLSSHALSGARAAFEKAFALDRQYAPAWALANFCLRHDDESCFWRAAARAALRSPSLADLAIADSGGAPVGASANLTDLAPLLDLAGHMEASPTEMLDRLAASAKRFAEADGATHTFARAIGTEFEKAWLNDLIVQERWDDATIIARRIEARREASNKAALDEFVNRLIAAAKASDAVEVWNGYASSATLVPFKGASLTNGDFAIQPTEIGFDWHLDLRQQGTEARQIEKHWQPKLLEFRLSGEQPEQVELAHEWMPVVPRTYRLRFEYSTREIAAPSGIRWEFVIATNGEDRNAESEPLAPSSEWSSSQWIFSNAGAQPLTLGRLRLIYVRESGSGRARGLFSLRRVSLETL